MSAKSKYLIIYIFSTILYGGIYVKASFPKILLITFNVIVPASQILLVVYGIYLLYQDYKLNKNRCVLCLSYVKWILLFTLYLVILTIFQGNIFGAYNNAFFIIHSVLFFLVMLIYCDKYKWMDSIIKFLIVFVSVFSLITVVTTIIFLITNTPLLGLISNTSIINSLLFIAPTGQRIVGLLTNVNTYAYLLIYSFYLYIFLIIYYKHTKAQILLIVLLANNLFNIFITGARGAYVSFFPGIIIFSLVLLLLMKRTSYRKIKFFKILIFSILAILVSLLVCTYAISTHFTLQLRYFIDENVIRIWNLKSGSGRIDIWSSLFSLDKRTFIFGLNDNAMYQMIKDMAPHYSLNLLNNDGRYHNVYITLLANYGIFALLGFLSFLIYSIVIIFKGYFKASFKRSRLILIFFFQFITFLISGIFEQLPLFSLSPHSLLFMFVWASTIILSTKGSTISEEKTQDKVDMLNDENI